MNHPEYNPNELRQYAFAIGCSAFIVGVCSPTCPEVMQWLTIGGMMFIVASDVLRRGF